MKTWVGDSTPTSLSVMIFRVVQVTPPGSPASIHFGTGLTSAGADLKIPLTIFGTSPCARITCGKYAIGRWFRDGT